MIKIIRKWIKAQWHPERRYWRIHYKNGNSMLLPFEEAKGIAAAHEGKVKLDSNSIKI